MNKCVAIDNVNKKKIFFYKLHIILDIVYIQLYPEHNNEIKV